MITEWGIDGPWEGTRQTAWSAYIEPTSTKKAEQYTAKYKAQMPVDDPRFLGSFIFYWGQKQETTQTWFSLFDENGFKTGAVASAQYLWTGNWPANEAPQIKYMLVDAKGANDNILYEPNQKANAEVFMLKPGHNIIKIQWQIFQEDWYKKDNINNTNKPIEIAGLITQKNELKATFITPAKAGPYRIFANLYDNYGNMATCNTPFYVVANNQ
ncbi:hypothetical protein [Mucilaginibacter gracilis]|uniref:hypothetical protein n=1 Tax=Mucilaginibacter gracilis TaxID=423350 RepID=UPI000EB4F88A|nr:hypothetical protein [Mucilaginibacter gracilis]